jgi:hypothetical protein
MYQTNKDLQMYNMPANPSLHICWLKLLQNFGHHKRDALGLHKSTQTST